MRSTPSWARRLLGWTTLAALAWAASVAALWAAQDWLIFRPTRLPDEHRFAVPPDVHETWIEVPGARLNALHLKLPAPDGVVFYLHGNGGSLSQWWIDPAFYRRVNLDVLMIDYRGYGKSGGRIESQAQLLDDVRRAWDSLAPTYAGKRRVILGRSLGSGPAAWLAAQVQPDLTLLVAPYESLAALARETYPWVPGALLRYPLPTDEWLARVRTPVLLLHGEHDTVIPASHSERLLARAPRARRLVVPGAGHGDLHRFEVYLQAVAQALRTSAASPS